MVTSSDSGGSSKAFLIQPMLEGQAGHSGGLSHQVCTVSWQNPQLVFSPFGTLIFYSVFPLSFYWLCPVALANTDAKKSSCLLYTQSHAFYKLPF